MTEPQSWEELEAKNKEEKEKETLTDKLVVIQSKLKAPKGQFNAFGKYKYRSCEDVLESLKPFLSEAKVVLYLTDEIILVGDRHYIKATATIENKTEKISVCAYAREPKERKGMDESQITGATSSYARKYALNGLFCIDDQKDPDSTNEHDEPKYAAGTGKKTFEQQGQTNKGGSY